MKAELFNHIKENHDTLSIWFKTHQKLQIGHDMLKPLIEPFTEAFPGVNLNGCPNCVLDMIGWALVEYKKETESQKTTEDDI
jgi:hypothetical protein